MNTKLTLRMDEGRIRAAKAEASRRGKSVSRMVEEFFDALASGPPDATALSPITASLVGVLKRPGLSEADYRDHLRRKYS